MPEMSKSMRKRLEAQGAILLGVEKNLLLRALEIVPVRLNTFCGNDVVRLTNDNGWALGTHCILHSTQARNHIEHALREWLRNHSALTTDGPSGATVHVGVGEDVSDPHYLTALCMAVCELEDER